MTRSGPPDGRRTVASSTVCRTGGNGRKLSLESNRIPAQERQVPPGVRAGDEPRHAEEAGEALDQSRVEHFLEQHQVRPRGPEHVGELAFPANASIEHVVGDHPQRHSRRAVVVRRSGSGCSRKNAHIRLVASMLWLVGPANHSGIGPPPGQVWPPSLNRVEHHVRVVAQFVYSTRVTSAATTDSTGFGPHRFLRAQFAVQAGMLGNGRRAIPTTCRRGTESPDRRSHETRSSAPVDGRCTSSTAAVSSRHHPDRRDPIGQRAGKHERHAAAVGKPVGIDPRPGRCCRPPSACRSGPR